MFKFKFLLMTMIMLLLANGAVNARPLEPIDGFYKKIFARTVS